MLRRVVRGTFSNRLFQRYLPTRCENINPARAAKPRSSASNSQEEPQHGFEPRLTTWKAAVLTVNTTRAWCGEGKEVVKTLLHMDRTGLEPVTSGVPRQRSPIELAAHQLTKRYPARSLDRNRRQAQP
jgi:hypothetical protein